MPAPSSASSVFWQRPRFWAVLLAIIVVTINLASMASAGAWDPWETHYGEVARNILIRHDPPDLWWQAGNGGPDATTEKAFWSKPALPFWLMALSMKIFGVGTAGPPDEMVQPFWPEMAIRLPSLLAGLGSAALLGHVAWRQVSPRAGILTAIVLVTMPQWAIATRQALTDMIFAGPVVLAAAAWILAWGQPDRALARRSRGRFSMPWDRAYLAFAVLLAISVIAPLAVLHQHAYDPHTWSTIGRNAKHAAALRQIQSHMFIYWGLLIGVVGLSLRWTRRSQVWMGVLYLAAGLSLLGKGMIGPGLVGALVLAHLVVTGRWDLLRRCGLPTGIVLFALASFPWHHAMVLFRGERWVNELIIQNNLARFGSGEQKQAVGSFAFYLETLGLAALPWSAIVPLALGAVFGARLGARGASDHEAEPEPDASSENKAGEGGSSESASSDGESSEPESSDDDAPAFEDYSLAQTAEGQRRVLHQYALVWFAVSLFAIGYSVTKYYHYLLPVLPPLALLVGLWIEARIRNGPASLPTRLVGVGVALAVLVAVVRDAFNTTSWIAHLTTYLYTGMWRTGGPQIPGLPWLLVPFGLGLLAWAMARYREAVAAFVLSGLLTTGWVIQDYVPAASENWSQRSAIRVYFAERGPNDRLVSWWFYYRGETWFTKQDVWVMKDVDRKKLGELFKEYEGQDASLWFITIEPHARRLKAQVPPRLRAGIEVKYESFHYTLMRVPMVVDEG